MNFEDDLKKALENQKTLASEIQDLNNTLIIKKEQFLKFQGIVEYLTGNGVTLTQQETTKDTEEL
jgi:hypothetical protein